MRALVSSVLCGAALGCAKEVSVDIGMAGESPLAIDLRYVELQHERDGWIRVDLPPTVRRGAEPVVLATAELPRGRYEALRVVYRASPDGRRVAEPRMGGGTRAEPPNADRDTARRADLDEATFWRPFCVVGQDDQILLRLLPVNPESGGTLQVDLHAPQC